MILFSVAIRSFGCVSLDMIFRFILGFPRGRSWCYQIIFDINLNILDHIVI